VSDSPESNQTRSDLREAALAAFALGDRLSFRLLEQAKKIAAADSTVLIEGESGTGKDLLASLLHYLGSRPEQPLIKIDCASLPHELLESELFGYERGAFTGATQMKHGRMELANRGTVVLDEISALSLPMQAKPLRVIEERKFDRLGGSKSVDMKARLIALSNISLEEAVARGSFREDLFYRLNVVPIKIAPLRERPNDIRPIANKLLSAIAENSHRPQLRLAASAFQVLEAYSFPGNVRELRNILERAVVNSSSLSSGSISDPTISAEDLPANLRNGSGIAASKPSLEELERNYIAEILDFTRGKKSKAAEILGISRKTLLEKRKKYRL
jgi:transcriptional regulator with PAS, ATPase and Fis domain